MSTISRLYYDVAVPSALSVRRKLQFGKKNSAYVIKACLEKYDAYTLHCPVRKRFASNP